MRDGGLTANWLQGESNCQFVLKEKLTRVSIMRSTRRKTVIKRPFCGILGRTSQLFS